MRAIGRARAHCTASPAVKPVAKLEVLFRDRVVTRSWKIKKAAQKAFPELMQAAPARELFEKDRARSFE